MKYLTALDKSEFEQNKQSEKDFSFTKPEEILYLPVTLCEGDAQHRDTCGCGRAFAGSETLSATTIGKVCEKSSSELKSNVENSAVFQEWSGYGVSPEEMFHELFELIDEALEPFEAGDLVRINNCSNSFYLYDAHLPIRKQE
jgi:hypothetical protein